MVPKHLVISLAVVTLFVAAGLWLLPALQGYRGTSAKLVEADKQVLRYQADNEELRQQIFQLKTDPRAIERVARDKFGFCDPREKIYEFPPDNP